MTRVPESPTAIIIGASRGLGLEMAREYLKRGWRVVATVRAESGTGLHDLADRAAGRLEIEFLDIVEQAQIVALKERLRERTFDLLFVNAGIGGDPAETIGQVSTEDFVRVMVTNALAPMRVVETFEGLVTDTGAIGIMSSGLGSIADNEYGGLEVYRGSKAALNMLMRSFAVRHADDPRALLLIAPGWVRTDMGGPDAELSVEDSIPGVVDTIAAQSGKPGLQFLDYRGRTLRW